MFGIVAVNNMSVCINLANVAADFSVFVLISVTSKVLTSVKKSAKTNNVNSASKNEIAKNSLVSRLLLKT